MAVPGVGPVTGLSSIYNTRPDLLDVALAAELDRITTDYMQLGLARSHIRERLAAALEGDLK